MLKRIKMKSIFLTEYLHGANILFYVRIGKSLDESKKYVIHEVRDDVIKILKGYGYVAVQVPGMMTSGYVCVHGKGKFKTFRRIIAIVATNSNYNFIEVKSRMYCGLSESDVSQEESEHSHDELVSALAHAAPPGAKQMPKVI